MSCAAVACGEDLPVVDGTGGTTGQIGSPGQQSPTSAGNAAPSTPAAGASARAGTGANVGATAGRGSAYTAGSGSAGRSGPTTGIAGAVAGEAGAGAAAGQTGSAGQGGAGDVDVSEDAGVPDGEGAAGSGAVAGSGGSSAGTGGAIAEAGAGGAGGAGGAAAAAGTGGSAAPARPAFVADGQPLSAPDKTWRWFEFANTRCRDGSPAGLSVNLSPASKKVVIFLQGGGACYDAATCLLNPSNIPNDARRPTDSGIFDRTRSENPVADWSYVYVPYCTGDVHIGDKENVRVDGVLGTQQFRGRANLDAFLKRLVPTFGEVDQVLLTGISAGGFGSWMNWEYVQWAFGSTPVTMIDDSGPVMSSDYTPACLTDMYIRYWGIDKSLYDFCGKECAGVTDRPAAFAAHLAQATRDLHGGLLEAVGDETIRAFNGVGINNGANDCRGSLTTLVSVEQFQKGLLDIRTRAQASAPNFGTFYLNGTQHTWLYGDSFYTGTAGNNVRLVSWFADILNGKPAQHIGL